MTPGFPSASCHRPRALFISTSAQENVIALRKDGTRRGTPPLRIVPGKHRKLQVAPTRRKLFGAKAKAEFLEWFAATCNISLSARKIGFHYRTVIRHWREDPAFGEQCVEALRIGYPRLEALALEGAIEALSPSRRGGRSRVKGDRAPPPETLAMTGTEALQLLREHKRSLAAASGGRRRDLAQAGTSAAGGDL